MWYKLRNKLVWYVSAYVKVNDAIENVIDRKIVKHCQSHGICKWLKHMICVFLLGKRLMGKVPTRYVSNHFMDLL